MVLSVSESPSRFLWQFDIFQVGVPRLFDTAVKGIGTGVGTGVGTEVGRKWDGGGRKRDGSRAEEEENLMGSELR